MALCATRLVSAFIEIICLLEWREHCVESGKDNILILY